MKRIRQYRRLSRVFLILALLSLIVQVETVFACSMLSQSGSSQFCCCNDNAGRGTPAQPEVMEHAMGVGGSDHTSQLSHDDQLSHDGHGKSPAKCCTFSQQLTMKGGALDDPEPVFAESKAQQTLLLTALVFVHTQLWAFTDTTANTKPASQGTAPATVAGSETYLATQRLRI